jgi:hypothetical protein
MKSTAALERRIDALAALAQLQRAQLACGLGRMRLVTASQPWQIGLGAASIVLSWWQQHRCRADAAPWLALAAAMLAAWRQPRG